MTSVTGISTISFVGTVVNDPTMQNIEYADHSHYTYTNATLRVVASVAPANADDQTVTWSYTNNTGTPISSIDASGNITFSGTEGIVTITAHAQDTSIGWYDTTIKLSVVYPDYVFNITNSHAAVRTDSTGRKWVEYRTYSAISAAIGDTKLELTSTLYGGTANANYKAYNSSTNNQVGFGNVSSNGSSSSTADNFAYRTTPLYGNLPKLNGTDYKIYAQRLGAYYIGYNVRVQDALSGLAISIDSTTSGPAATTDGAYTYLYQGSTVVLKAALQTYSSQNIADIYDASANWIAGPEFTVTRLVGTRTLGGVSGLFLESGVYYYKASIYINSYTATPTLTIKAVSPDTLSAGYNPVIRRSVTGINSITGTTTVQVGSTTTLTSSVQPANAYNQSITWSSSNTAIATVNASTGVVTGVASGTATITAVSAESASYSTTTTVTVTGIPATSISAISFTGSTPVRTNSTGLSVSATVSPANASNKVIVYTSSSTSVATVDASGNITPVSAGTTTITATASDTTNGTLSSTYSLTVYNPVAAISSITRTGFPATIYTDSSGMSISASITTSDVANSAVVYSTDASGVATVGSSTGEITIVGVGSVTLTATSSENGAVSSTTTFTVYNRVAAISSITRTGFPATIYTDSSGMSISATITTANVANSAVVYSTDASGVATVNASTGAVAIVGVGSVTLTATSSENGAVSSTTTFTVYNRVAAISAITRTGFPTTIYTDSSGMSISATITTANVANSAVVYSTDASGVATVNASTGEITIVGVGSVTLTATSSENGAVSSTTTFTVYNRVAAISDITPSWGSATVYTDSSGLSISATITTSNVADSSVSYSSSDTGVATINSSTGALIIVAAGSTILRVESVENSSIYKTYSLTVNSQITTIATTGLTEITSDHTVYNVGNYNDRIIYVGSTETSVQLYTSVEPGNATNQSVQWKFYNNNLQTRVDATIDNSGLITFSAGSSEFASGSLDPMVIQGGFMKRLLIIRSQPPANTNSIASQGTVGTYTTMNDIVGANVAVTGVSDISSNHSIYVATPGTDRIIYVSNSETSVNLYAVVAPTNATNQAITWAIANSQTNVSVNSSGVVSFQANASFNSGIIIVTATANGFNKGIYIARGPPNGSYTLQTAGTVGYGSPNATVAVTGISSTTLSGGSTPFYTTTTGLSVSATVTPNNATNQTVSYSSGTTAVATVGSSSGAITIVGAGTTTLTSTSADGSYTSTYSLTVYNRPAAISALTGSWGSSTVYTTSTGLSVSASVTTSNVYNSAITYSSSNTAVATVDASGAITVVGAGTTTLSAVPADNTNNVAASTRSLTVNAVASGAITSISNIVFDSEDPMHPNQWNTASVTVQPTSNSDSITWTSSDSSVVKIWDDDNVSTDAVIFAKGTGLATIRAASTLNPSIYKEYSMRVYARTTTMTSISFTGSSPFRAGATGTVSCAVAPYPSPSSPYTSAYQGITWLSSDESVAIVDASGVVTGVAQGRVVIYGTTIGIPVRKQSYVLTVAAAATPVTGISALTYTGAVPFRVNAVAGSLTATTIPANATNTNIIYTSDNSGVASISSTTGRIYGYSVGSCTITATTEDGGFSTTYPLTVDVEYINVQRIANLTLTAPSPVRANSANVSVSGIAYGANDTTPTNGTLYYYTSTVPMCSINKTTGEITFRGTAGTAIVYAVSADDPTIRSNNLSITVLSSYVALTGITDISANNQSPVLLNGQKTLYIRNGGTLQLRAAPVPSNATDNAITWASSNAGITVDASGLATIVTPDTDTVITATNANSTSKTVNLKHIINVEGVDEISLSIGANTTIELNTTATALSGTYPANATYPGVQWSATPSGIISIDQSGNISTVSVGSTTIYARAIDNSGIYQTYNLSVIVPFVEITGMGQITYTGPKYLHVNETGASVSAYVMPTTATNKAVSYTWSPLNLLSIDASGNITALATGTATIYASATESDGTTVHDSEYVLTIYPETVSITDIGCLEPDVILDVGSTFGFRNPMLPPYATNNQVAWVSSDPDIASVNENGTVTGVARGTTTIHATSTVDNSLTASYEITVSAVPVSDITPIGTSTTVYTLISTNTMQMTAQVVPSNAGNKTINWTVSDTSIATIDASGYITGIAPGAVVVRASADDNPTIYREITVTITSKVVTGISAISSPANVRTVEFGYTLQLGANVLPLNATNQEIRWTSNSSIIEVVNATTGLVRGKVLSNSSVTITATTVDGNYRAFYTLTCVPVKVQDMDPITTSTGDTVMNIGDTLTMTTQVLPLDAVTRNYGWAFDADTSNELQLMQSVASLNANTGEVSALSTGYALFKATSGGQTNAGTYVVKTITIQVGEPVESLTPITYGATTVLNQGTVVQLGTTTVPSMPTQTGIYWSSSSPAATISQTGVLTVASSTAVKSFTITATPTPYNLDASGNTISVSQIFSIYVEVSGMATISPSTTTIKRGQTRNLYATISPTNADNKAVVLTVESATNNVGQSVADTSTILVSGTNANGPYIQGVALGTATIKMASVENPAIFRTLTLNVQ